MPSAYNLQEHIHRFAVWAAARASQRGFAKTEVIQKAINATGLRKLAEGQLPHIQKAKDFDKFHTTTCRKIINHFDSKTGLTCSYGRAAKIVAVYLKTAVVLPRGGAHTLSSIIHPPIDSILLKNLRKQEVYKKFILYNTRWTQLNQQQYWQLWEKLVVKHQASFWKLEEAWEAVG